MEHSGLKRHEIDAFNSGNKSGPHFAEDGVEGTECYIVEGGGLGELGLWCLGRAGFGRVGKNSGIQWRTLNDTQ